MPFADGWTGLAATVEGWPDDVRETARAMAAEAWRNGAVVPW